MSDVIRTGRQSASPSLQRLFVPCVAMCNGDSWNVKLQRDVITMASAKGFLIKIYLKGLTG